MARNNEDRFGAKTATATGATAPPTTTTGEPAGGLSFATPTEFVDLPSKGRFYPEGSTLHGRDTIEIRFMTAKEEDILTSKTLLKKGLAVDRMLENIIVDKNIKLSELLVGDKNALIVAARISGYGAEYNTKINCPACMTVEELQFDLDSTKINEGVVDDPLISGPTANGTYQITLPRCKAVAEVKLFTGVEEKKMSQRAAMRARNKLPETQISDQIRLSIVSVNGDSSQGTINELINNMPAFDSRYLRRVYGNLMPNVELKHEFSCTSCGYDAEVEVPFTVEFFWPK